MFAHVTQSVILHEHSWKRKKYLIFEIICIDIYPGNFNKALIIQLNQLAHNFLGN